MRTANWQGLLLATAGLLALAPLTGCSDSGSPAGDLVTGDVALPPADIPPLRPDVNADATPPVDAPGPADGPAADAVTGTCTAGGPTVVTFATQDGVQLEADLYTQAAAGAPVAILLHMVPPSNDRTNYPAAFISALTERGFAVLNVDRRGAGGSGGDPQDAYLGDLGKLDARGARDFLAAHPCAFDLDRLAIVGASNGSTTTVDYTLLAAGDDALETPAALVFLTGGTYTEAQTVIEQQRPVFEPLPVLFVFSTDERAWSIGYQPDAPASWVFQEYDPGGHGVRMFGVQPDSIEVVADFLEGAVQ